MDVIIADKKLHRLDAEPSYTAGLSPALVRAFRMRMQSLRAAPDETTLAALRSMDIQDNGRPCRRLIRLDSKTRLVVDFHAKENRTILQVVGIENGAQKGRRAK